MYRSCRCMYRSARSWAGVILTGSAGGCEASGCAGAGAGTVSSAGTVFGGLALFLLPGGRPLRFGTGAGVGGSAGVGTVAGAGSGSGSAGSAGSAAAGSGSEATGGVRIVSHFF